MFQSLRTLGARYIDYRMAWLGAVGMGLIVWLVNLSHGVPAALVAAAKQAAYTFFFAGVVTRTCERLAVLYKDPNVAYTLAILVPSAMAIGFTYILHSLKGTPEPFLSTLPTIILAPPAFLWWSRKKRAAMEHEEEGDRR